MRRFINLYLVMLGAILMFSCNKENNECDVLADYESPVWFILQDTEGNNLLDPTYDGNILDKKITITRDNNGHALQLNLREFDSMTDDYDGLYLSSADVSKTPCIAYYKILGLKDSDKTTHFLLDWGDDTTDEVEVAYYYTISECEPIVHYNVLLNGIQHSDKSLVVTITK